MTKTGQVKHTGETRNMNRIVTREIFTEVPGLDGTVLKLDLKMTCVSGVIWLR